MNLKTTKTVVVVARVDARSLATIATAFAEKKILIKSRSHLNSLIIETFCSSLVDSDIVTRVKTTDEALDILMSLGIGFEKSLQRCLVSLAKQIDIEQAIDGVDENLQGVEGVTKSKLGEALNLYKKEEK